MALLIAAESCEEPLFVQAAISAPLAMIFGFRSTTPESVLFFDRRVVLPQTLSSELHNLVIESCWNLIAHGGIQIINLLCRTFVPTLGDVIVDDT